MNKIFIIAPHFPPSALPPSQRARLLVRHFKSLGYFPYIFTSDPKYREEQEDPWMVELVGNDFELFIVKTKDPKKTRKLGFGDLGIRMLPSLYKELKRKAKELNPDFILYLVPPWYVLTISKRLKKKTGVPYGIDFIDPWVVPPSPEDTFKKKLSQFIARIFERKAVHSADIIYSVSLGINENLKKYHHLSSDKPLFAIPYGVEPSDYDFNPPGHGSDLIVFRYIGAIWDNAYPVLEVLLHALSLIEKEIPLKVEFYGTSYAGAGLAKPVTKKWSEMFQMQNYFTEEPLRVSYKKAVELTLSSDIVLLFGGILSYYAASKLMGLIASRKPFIAFLHEDSFPSVFLKQLEYQYIVTYSEKNPPDSMLSELIVSIKKLISEKNNFVNFDLNNPIIQKHTALGMTKSFIDPINKLLNNNND